LQPLVAGVELLLVFLVHRVTRPGCKRKLHYARTVASCQTVV
jgi:hypothetical protein